MKSNKEPWDAYTWFALFSLIVFIVAILVLVWGAVSS